MDLIYLLLSTAASRERVAAWLTTPVTKIAEAPLALLPPARGPTSATPQAPHRRLPTLRPAPPAPLCPAPPAARRSPADPLCCR